MRRLPGHILISFLSSTVFRGYCAKIYAITALTINLLLAVFVADTASAGELISAPPLPITVVLQSPDSSTGQTTPATEPEKPAKLTKNASGQSTKNPNRKRASSSATTELELSAFTSEISDHFTGRVNILRTDQVRRAWIRTGYTIARSRTYTKAKVNETDLSTLTADFGLRRGEASGYRFLRFVANYRTRESNLRDYPKKAGYSMFAIGVGRTIFSILESEISLASVSKINKAGATEKLLIPVYSFGLKTPLTSSATLDGDLRLIEPFTDNPLVDLRLNLTYKLTEVLSLRVSYLANNMLNNLLIPVSSRPETDWDKSLRVSLVFSKSTK